MYIYQSLGVEDYVSISGGIPHSEYPEFDEEGTTEYVVGDRVWYDADNKEYEALQDMPFGPNSGEWHRPGEPSGEGWWQLIGWNNRYRPFDNQLFTTGTQPFGSNINYVLVPSYEIDTVTLFNVVGYTVQVTVQTLDGSSNIWNEIINILNPLQTDAYGYGFAPGISSQASIHQQNVRVTGIPFVLGEHRLVITITPHESLDIAQVGQICCGFAFNTGETLEDANAALRDFSRKEVNEFGNVEIIKRAYSLQTEYPIAVPKFRYRAVDRVLLALRNSFCVTYANYAVGNEIEQDLSLLNFGFIREYTTTFKASDYVYIFVAIEGVA